MLNLIFVKNGKIVANPYGYSESLGYAIEIGYINGKDYLSFKNDDNPRFSIEKTSDGIIKLVLIYKHLELGINKTMIDIFIKEGVKILTASDAHKPEDVGANISELLSILSKKENK